MIRKIVKVFSKLLLGRLYEDGYLIIEKPESIDYVFESVFPDDRKIDEILRR